MDDTAEQKTDMDLVNIINATEGFAWRLNHDASHDRIPSEGIDDSIKQLMTQRDDAVTKLKKRTGIETHEDMRNYVQGKLKEQDQLWDKQWSEIYREGTVFKITGGGRYGTNIPHVLETIRAYLPTHGTFGPNQIILARIHNSGQILSFDDSAVPELKKLDDVKPMYKQREVRGIVKYNEEKEKRITIESRRNKDHLWREITETGTVFTHAGFNEDFETFKHYNLPNRQRDDKNEVVLAKSHTRPLFVEFTPKDLSAITLSTATPKYVRKEGCMTYGPKWTLDE